MLARILEEPDEDLIHVTPTIIHRDTHTAAVVEHEDGRALIVFRSEEEAEKYRRHTGKQPEEEGFKPVAVDLEDLANIIRLHDCTHVAMPEPWTGNGLVDFFAAGDFIGMFRESADV